ncbi:MAG: hemolysin family protein [Longimicrobiales bacterium]|nr:hemolysin family protein [Longimicrobiales bacterium]
MTTLIWVLALSLSISFLCSILEAVLLSVSHSYVGVLRDQGVRAGELLHRMQLKIDEPIAAILTLNTIAHTLGAYYGGSLALEVFGSLWGGVFGAGLTLAILIFTEIIPKTLGATFWQQLAVPAAYVLRAMIVAMKPVLLPLNGISRFFAASTRGPTVSRAEIEVLAEIGRREGTLDEDEWRVVSNVIRLDELTIGEVMTPRTDMTAVPVDATVEEAKDLMLDQGHLRLPVYDGNLDAIVGILLARDLWRADRGGEKDIRRILRTPSFAPASKAVEDLIPEMRAHRNKMVIVLDEFGGTAGLVTLEDLIEEIIGEIQDEHEGDEPEDFQRLEDGRWRVWGGVPLREAAERLHLDLPVDRYDTLGGYLFGRLSRVGRIGDRIPENGGAFRVARMRGRRIEYTFWESEPRDEG